MILNEVIYSGTLPQKKFVVRSEEDYEILQCKAMKTNLFQGQLGRRSLGIACPHFVITTPVPRNFSSFATIRDAFPGGQGYGGTRKEQGAKTFGHTPLSCQIVSLSGRAVRRTRAPKSNAL